MSMDKNAILLRVASAYNDSHATRVEVDPHDKDKKRTVWNNTVANVSRITVDGLELMM